MKLEIKGDFLGPNVRSIPLVIDAVSEIASVAAQDIVGASRAKNIVRARFMAMAICRDYCGASYPDIGRAFNRDHTTVMHALRRVTELMSDDDLDDMEAIAESCGLIEEGTV